MRVANSVACSLSIPTSVMILLINASMKFPSSLVESLLMSLRFLIALNCSSASSLILDERRGLGMTLPVFSSIRNPSLSCRILLVSSLRYLSVSWMNFSISSFDAPVP